MTRLWQVFRPSAAWWVAYLLLVVAASAVEDVAWPAKTLLILSGVVLGAAVRRLAW